MATNGLGGVNISITPVVDFDALSKEEATKCIEEQILPICENEGLKLFSYGNLAGESSLGNVEKYDSEKRAHTLFDVEKIQKIYASLDLMVVEAPQKIISSNYLMYVAKTYLKGSFKSGDIILAMMLKGYAAYFEKQSGNFGVNCDFNARILIKK